MAKLFQIFGILSFRRSFCTISNNSKQFSNHLLVKSDFKVTSRSIFYSKPPLNNVQDLTNFPVIYWPNILKCIKDQFMARLIISKFHDKEFSFPQFVAGSKQAVAVVSEHLSKGKLNELEDLVSGDVLNEVKLRLKKLNYKQYTELKVDPNDIYFSFPYNVGISYPDKNDKGKKYAQITMCYHIFTGHKALMKEPEFSLKQINLEGNIFILNYRFIRNYSVGIKPSESYWLVNGLNHSRPLLKNKF